MDYISNQHSMALPRYWAKPIVQSRKMMKKYLNSIFDFMASLNLAIFILAGMAFLIMIQAASGHLLDAFENLPWLKGLAAKDFYHSGGFSVLLGLFCCNLLACNLKRLPTTLAVLRSASKELEDDELTGSSVPLVRQLTTPDPEAAADAFVAAMTEHFKKPLVVRQEPDARCFFAEKSRYSHLGFYFAHLSILFVALGVIISTTGYRHSFTISKGERLDPLVIRDSRGERIRLPFSLVCDDYTVHYYEGTSQIEKHRSLLSIFEGERKVKTQEIDFARSLNYKGFEIYQERFNGEIKVARINIASSDPGRRVMEVKNGSIFSLEGLDTEFRLVRVTPDFIKLRSSVSNEVIRVSKRPAGFSDPALRDYRFSLAGTLTRDVTKLKVVRDPGRTVIWFAVIGMLAGFAVVFFLPHQRIWLSIRGRGEESVMTLAGATNKDIVSFEEIFRNIAERLESHGVPLKKG